MLRIMVIILNIDIIRALTGDYHDIVISKDNIKCYGYRIVKSFRNGFLDIGDISKDKLTYTVIEDFLRKDILVFAPDTSKDMKDIISRKDGKTLRIDRSLLSSGNNDLLNLLNTRIRKSISNILYEDKGYLEININKDELKIIDKKSGNVCFRTCHLDILDLEFIYDLLLQEVRTADGIKVYQNSLERLRVNIDFLNTKVIVTGNSKYMQMLIAKSIKLREEIKTAKHLQLKMEGF